jgi:integrase/recombinase XerD
MKSKGQVLEQLEVDIRLRGLAENTLESYSTSVRIFLEYCNRPIEQLNEEDIRSFLLHLLQEKKLSPKTMNCYSGALRFFFAVTLNRTLNYLQIPRQKKHRTLPEVLTKAEVFAIIESCKNLKHKAMLSIIYSAGLRVSEAAALKACHIDSKLMRVFVQCGKGGKDRFTILSENCLRILREYWTSYRPNNPEGWLFLGTYNVCHITTAGISYALKKAVERAGITKDVSVHSLRHSFATHLLEDGVSLLQIKELLGHSSIQTTTIYLHLANVTAGITSPLDTMPTLTSSEDDPNE